MSNRLKCCVVHNDDASCPHDAAAELYFGPTPYDLTHVCADHVHYFAGVISVRKLDSSDHAQVVKP